MKSSSLAFAWGVSLLALMASPVLAQGMDADKAETKERKAGSDKAQDTEISTIIVTGHRGKRSYKASSGVGSKVAEDPREIPQSLAVISRQRLEDQNIRTSTEALAQVPGFNSTSKEGFFTLRGFSTGTTVDGAPSGSVAGRTDVDIEVFEQIEVLKGAAALLQGTGDPGGVVNYVFKKPTNRFAASAKIGAGSYNNRYGGADIGGPITEDKSLRARGVVFYEDRDLYTSPEFRQRLSLYGTLQYDLTPRTTLSGGYHRQETDSSEGFRQGLPTYINGELLDVSPRTSLSQDWNRWNKLSTSWLADIEHRFSSDWIAKLAWRRGRAALPSTVAYTGASRGGVSTCANAVPGAGGFLTGTYAGVNPNLPYGSLRCMHTEYYEDRTGTNSVDGFVSGSFNLFDLDQKLLLGYNRRQELFSRVLTAGAAANDFVIDILNPNPHVRDRPNMPAGVAGATTKTVDEGIYGRLTVSPVEWLKFPIGARVGWVTDSAGRKTADGKVIPYYGVVADVTSDFSLYASYVESFTPASATVRVWPDGNVPPVTGEQYEAGIKGLLFDGAVQVSTSVFQITRKNSTSTDPAHPAAGGLSYVILTGERKTEGFEAQVNGEILPNWSVGLAYALTNAKVSKDVNYKGQLVDGTPKHALNLWTNYRFTEGELDGLSVGGGVRSQTRQRGSFSCTTALLNSNPTNPRCAPRIVGPGYTTVSMRLGYALTENFDVAVNADNLFNKRYWESVGSVAGSNYLGTPRQVQVTLRARY